MLPIWQAMLRSGARERRLREEFAQRGTELVQLYRHGPFKLEVLFKLGAAYWSIDVSVNREQPWTQEQLDAQLDGDLLDALDQWFVRKHALDPATTPRGSAP